MKQNLLDWFGPVQQFRVDDFLANEIIDFTKFSKLTMCSDLPLLDFFQSVSQCPNSEFVSILVKKHFHSYFLVFSYHISII